MPEKLTSVDRPTAKMLAEAVVAALKPLSDELGVNIVYAGGSISTGTSMTLKLEIAIVNGDGLVMSQDASDFTRYASSFGLRPEDLGTEFLNGGKRYKIVGLNPNRPRFPVSAERMPDRKRFKFAISSVQAGLA